MSTKKNKPPLGLDMGFGEALKRFVSVDPKDLRQNKDKKPIKDGTLPVRD